MYRARVICGRYPAQLALAFGILLGAAVLLATCLASLASAAPNRLGMFVGGQVDQSNSRSLSLILSARRMVPGQVACGTVVIANDGGATQRLFLGADAKDAVGGGGGGRLSQELQLVVTDVTTAGHPCAVYRGAIAGLAGAPAGSIAAGQSRTYRFTVTFPSTADERFAGSSLSVSFDWTATE